MHDARALWVNPAGLGRWDRASVHFDILGDDPGAQGRLRQLTAGFETGGFSFGYQRDVFDAGVRGHTYRLGLGLGPGRFAAGVALALYRGDTKGSGWDLGAAYRVGPASIGALLANLKQPVVRGVLQRATLTPAVTLGGSRGLFALSLAGRFTPDSSLGYAAGAHVATPGRTRIALLARLDTDRSLRRVGWTFGVSIGGRDVLGVVASTTPGGSDIAALNVYGVSTRAAAR